MEQMKQPAVSVIISCWNEEDNIAACLKAVLEAMPEAEVLVVAGGNDRTADLADEWAKEYPLVRVVRHVPDRGKGHAIRDGSALARAPVIAQFDADLQFLATDLPAIVAPILSGQYDVCIGSRFQEGIKSPAERSWSRNFGNFVLSRWVSLLTGHRLTDVTAGLKAWTREAINRIDFRDDTYSYEAEIVVRTAVLGLRILEIPVGYAARSAGVSMHTSTLRLAKAGIVIAVKSLLARLRRG